MLTNDHGKRLIKELEAARNGRMLQDVFTDFVRMSALAIESPLTRGEQHRDIEDEFSHIRAGYTDEQYEHIRTALAIVVDALEDRRVEFLGTVLEEIGASNVRNGQFFTPPDLAALCARVVTEHIADDYEPGKVMRLNDPSCGACVTLIAGGEEMRAKGVRQRDIYIEAGDIDRRALDIGYIELSLLGYAAEVKHQDALTMEQLSRTRYTPGFFLHGFPMRGVFANPPFAEHGKECVNVEH